MLSDGNARIAFRVAASTAIGGGHVVRSVSIADALTASGATCTFFANAEAINTAPLLARSDHMLITAPNDTAGAVALANVQGKFDWLIVDDYALAALHETPWRAVAKKILALDDLADRPHDCDLLVDSTPSRASGDYLGLVPAQARLLLGSSYAPLRAEFSLNRHIALERRKQTSKLQRLLVSFGLVDPGGITAEAVTAVAHAMPDLAMDVVLGTQSQSRARIEALGRTNITLHIDPPSMPALMISADIALGAGGSTAWERACLALPAVALILADNQRALTSGLERRGALAAIELNKDCWPHVIAALRTLYNDAEAWRTMSLKAARACDGLGAQRLVVELNPPRSKSGETVRLRPVRLQDFDQIFMWQTAPRARIFSSNPEPPSPKGHQNWMMRKLDDPGCVFSIIEEGDVPAGVLRMDQRRDGSFIISVLVGDTARGRGVGLAALRAGTKLMQGHTLWAKIDARNTFSLRLFAKAGFIKYDENLYCRVSRP
jgi:UDP-2,4-diacetamido-2,4,6-trideoxy-beta-L-altropyranose hydrolase